MRSETLDVRTLASPLPFARVGIVVPRFSHTIVERNRIRRRLRELVRTHVLPQIPPQDVLVRANRSAYARSFVALEREIRSIARNLTDAG